MRTTLTLAGSASSPGQPERVDVDSDQVRELPGFQGADLAAHPQYPSVVAGGRHECLHRRNGLRDQARLSGYTAGRCRCVHCRGAFAGYRALRCGEGLDDPRPARVRESDGHLPAQWFRSRFWWPACLAAGIDPPVRLHDLRHSNASWLLAGGEHIEKVRDRLGHTSIVTTQKYLHSLPNADDTAIEALARVRGRRGPRPA